MRERTPLSRDVIERLAAAQAHCFDGPAQHLHRHGRGQRARHFSHQHRLPIDADDRIDLGADPGQRPSSRPRKQLDPGRRLADLDRPRTATARCWACWVSDVGGEVARIGRAFGMKIIAWSQNLTPEMAAAAGATLVTKDELFQPGRHVVTIHLILSERTRGLVGAAELALMKPTARLINTSRGPIVDEGALFEALARARSQERRSTFSTRSPCRRTPLPIPRERAGHAAYRICRRRPLLDFLR